MIDKRRSLYRRMKPSLFIGIGALTLLSVSILLGKNAQAYPTVTTSELLNPYVHASEQIETLPKSAEGVRENQDAQTPSDNIQKLDLIIGQAIDEFYHGEEARSQRSELRMIMHCLAHRENGHAANNHCGDSGKACGPFQFHPDTWVRARKAMIADGLATEIGDRYDLKESARTTVFAVKESEKKHPRIKISEWGPILRDMNGSNYASCQKPSWLN